MEHLPDSTNLLYSELLQQALHCLPVDKGISYISKRIGGKRYWYMELVAGSVKRQASLGPDSPELRRLIEQQKALAREAVPELDSRRRLVAMLAKGGAATPSLQEARVLEVLERAGIFQAGATLIGSHAFVVCGNMLGVRWASSAVRTQDMDLASPRHLPLALPADTRPLREILEASNLGFFEVPALDRKSPSTQFKIRGREFHVDILTPLTGPPRKTPVYLPNLRTHAYPMRYLEYLLEDTQPAAVVALHGILVNVPAPARLALHKLVVAQRRTPAEHIKQRKDRQQAGELLSALLEGRPGDLILAIEAAERMPPRFQLQLRQGIRHLAGEQQSALQEYGLRP